MMGERTRGATQRRSLASWAGAALLVVLSIVGAFAAVETARQRPLSPLEDVLFQVLTLGTGLAGSFFLGRFSVEESARKLVRPHAQKAFRRLTSHFQSLSRLVIAIDNARENSGSSASAPSHYDTLRAMVVEQISTAGDALEDWRDIVPDEVQEMEEQARRRREEHEKQGIRSE